MSDQIQTDSVKGGEMARRQIEVGLGKGRDSVIGPNDRMGVTLYWWTCVRPLLFFSSVTWGFFEARMRNSCAPCIVKISTVSVF